MCSPELMGESDQPVEHELMGRLVRVVIERDPLRVIVGWLVELDADGAFTVEDADGNPTHGWPALEITSVIEAPDEGPEPPPARRTEVIDPEPFL